MISPIDPHAGFRAELRSLFRDKVPADLRARLRSGEDLVLPAVTFATLPLLTEASGGRVPNPYA